MVKPASATESAFISLGEAAEALLAEGFSVTTKGVKTPGISSEGKVIFADGALVAGGYKDGSTWKFKREAIDNFVASKSKEKSVG